MVPLRPGQHGVIGGLVTVPFLARFGNKVSGGKVLEVFSTAAQRLSVRCVKDCC